MQRAKTHQVFDRDLKDAISQVRKEEYRKAIEEVHDLDSLSRIDHEIRSNFQLTRDDRLQLLGEAELALASRFREGIVK